MEADIAIREFDGHSNADTDIAVNDDLHRSSHSQREVGKPERVRGRAALRSRVLCLQKFRPIQINPPLRGHKWPLFHVTSCGHVNG